MKLDQVANSGNDEFYTPKYAVIPIVKFIEVGGFKKIWCPFDTEESNFVKVLKSRKIEVENSHISSDGDFFKLNRDCDAIVSNPPYSLKFEVFERLFKLGKPFAMLVGVVGLFESEKRFSLFETNDFEIMYFNRRISYFKNFSDQKPSLNPPFSSVYITKGMLPNRMIFQRINKNDA